MTSGLETDRLAAELAAAHQRILELERDKANRKVGIAELAPAWIGARATLIVALAGIGFFAGRATRDAGTDPLAKPPNTTAAAPTTSSTPPGTQVSPGAVFLSTRTLPPPKNSIGGLASGSVQIGTATFANSVRFTCSPFGYGFG